MKGNLLVSHLLQVEKFFLETLDTKSHTGSGYSIFSNPTQNIKQIDTLAFADNA